MTGDKKTILDQLALGMTLKLAANSAGYDASEMRDMMRADPPFAARVREAIARGARPQLQKVLDSNDWRAAAWYLERVHRDEFGAHQTLAVESSSPDEVWRELALLLNPRALTEAKDDDEG